MIILKNQPKPRREVLHGHTTIELMDVRTGKSFQLPLKIAAEGARYSKEFAAFLKETYGCIPRDLPYA